MIVKLDKRTVEVVGKWTCLLMLICLPIRIGVYLYENSELGMIKKHVLYMKNLIYAIWMGILNIIIISQQGNMPKKQKKYLLIIFQV